MKTNLSKILSVSGQHGLYRYLAQARNGAIAESLSTGKRTIFGYRNRISTLYDIAIYTDEGEKKLSEVFTALKETLGDSPAPSSKSPDNQLRELFAKAVPNYDADRFLLSHMKKVVDWYNELKQFASLDFTETDADSPAEEAEGQASEDEANA